jgi:hypothetical protein
MDTVKHRTQISLDDWQYQILLDESRKMNKSLSALIREMITEKFTARSGESGSDPLFDIVGIGASGQTAIARNHDSVLYGKKP